MATATPVVAATTQNAAAQLYELRKLRNGWLDGYGVAPSLAGLDWLSERFARLYPADAPAPYIYPTYDGSIQAEWTLGRREISLCIDLSTHTAEWLSVALNSDDDDVEERVLSLDDAADWAWLGDELRHSARSRQ